jgi:dTDP-4-dehydrorhamnose 3,5-epimerase-like enzyme
MVSKVIYIASRMAHGTLTLMGTKSLSTLLGCSTDYNPSQRSFFE